MSLTDFKDVAAGIQASIQANPDAISARKRFALEVANLGNRLISGKERVAWCGVLAPFDLLYGMGVASCYVEFVGGWLASIGAVEPMLITAEQKGFATDCCSYHRAAVGAALQGLMPEPEFLIATSTPCSGGMATVETLARHFGKDLFSIYVPQRSDEQAVAYLAEQYRAMARFVSEHTGEPMDRDRVGTAIENTNRTRELLIEVFELAQAVPTPARRRDLINFGIVLPLVYGTEGAVEVVRGYRDEYARKVEAKMPGVPGERVRLMWLQNRIQFKSPVEEFLEESLGAAIVFDELNQINWEPIDPDEPFEGMARRALSITLTGPVEDRIRLLGRQAKAYKVDGAINPCHWGCRQGTGTRGLVEQGLRQAGVPVLNLEVDCVDSRQFSEGQVRTRLEAFVEMLAERKGC